MGSDLKEVLTEKLYALYRFGIHKKYAYYLMCLSLIEEHSRDLSINKDELLSKITYASSIDEVIDICMNTVYLGGDDSGTK